LYTEVAIIVKSETFANDHISQISRMEDFRKDKCSDLKVKICEYLTTQISQKY
jgi:hypothetical protein